MESAARHSLRHLLAAHHADAVNDKLPAPLFFQRWERFRFICPPSHRGLEGLRSDFGLLRPSEQQIAQQLCFDKDRNLYTQSHVCCAGSCSPRRANRTRWSLSKGSRKTELSRASSGADPTSLQPGSHSHDVVACAVTDALMWELMSKILSEAHQLDVADRFFHRRKFVICGVFIDSPADF